MNLIAQEAPTVEHRTSLSLRWHAARDDFRTRRTARASRETLKRELASYSTPAERHELNAILDRADPDSAAEIRRLIQRGHVA